MSRFGTKLRSQLLLPLLIFEGISLIIIILAAFYMYQVQRQGAIELQQQTAAGVVKDVENFLENLEIGLLHDSASEEWTRLTVGKQQEALGRLQTPRNSYTEMALVNQAGHKRASLVARAGALELPSEWAGHEALTRIFIGDTYNGPIEFHEGVPYMFTAVPVRDSQLHIAGMLVVQVDLSALGNIVAAGGSGHSGYTYLIDREGNLIAARDSDRVTRREDVTRIKGVRAALDSKQPSGMYGGLHGGRVIGSMERVAEVGWRVIAELPTGEAFDYLNSLLLLLGAWVLIGVGLTAGVWRYINRRVVQPILTITQGAQVIGQGELEHRIAVEAGEELMNLADEINATAAQRQSAELERQQAEQDRARLQQEIIEAQQLALHELSTPIIPVMDQILIMPLVGSIDSMRAKDIMRALLAGIHEHRASVVILDITGVPIVDSGVAGHLDKTIQAARLKGAHTIVTGISDAVAEAVVDLGIDWSALDTLSDLQTGLVSALDSMGIELNKQRGR